MLARATGRQREMSVRLAIGASRSRLVRQTLVESALSPPSAARRVLVELAGRPAARRAAARRFGARLHHARCAGALHRCSSRPSLPLLFGLAPALRGSAVDVNRALKEESSAAGGGVQHARLRKALVVAQVALSTLLVAGAGLFARSLTNLKTLGPGFDTDHIVSFTLDPVAVGPIADRDQAALRHAGRRSTRAAGRDRRRGRRPGRADRQHLAAHHPRAGLRATAGREHESVDARGRPRLLRHARHTARRRPGLHRSRRRRRARCRHRQRDLRPLLLRQREPDRAARRLQRAERPGADGDRRRGQGHAVLAGAARRGRARPARPRATETACRAWSTRRISSRESWAR